MEMIFRDARSRSNLPQQATMSATRNRSRSSTSSSRRLRLRPPRPCGSGLARSMQRLCCARQRLAPAPRSPAPLPKRAPRRSSSVATVAPRGSVALAESGLVTGLAVKSCPSVPPTQLRLPRASRAPLAASSSSRPSGTVPGSSAGLAQASEAPPDAASDSDSDWGALLDAHSLNPPPSVAAAAVAQPADAAGAGRRARDKRCRRLRKAAKRSTWREI